MSMHQRECCKLQQMPRCARLFNSRYALSVANCYQLLYKVLECYNSTNHDSISSSQKPNNSVDCTKTIKNICTAMLIQLSPWIAQMCR